MMYFREEGQRIYGIEDLVTVVNPMSEDFSFQVHSVPHTVPAGGTWRGLGYMADIAIEGLIKKMLIQEEKILRANDETFQKTYFEKIYVTHKSPLEQETLDEAERQAKQIGTFASPEDAIKPEEVLEEEFPDLKPTEEAPEAPKTTKSRKDWTPEERKAFGAKMKAAREAAAAKRNDS